MQTVYTRSFLRVRFFRPDSACSSAAAEAALSGAFHFNKLQAWDCLQCFSGCFVDVVAFAKEAWVVVSDMFLYGFCEFDFSCLDGFCQEFSVMLHVEFGVVVGFVVFEGVVAVG